MNTNKYTQKTLEALQSAQQLAIEYQNQALEPEHLLAATASQQDGLIPQLLMKLGVEPGNFAAAAAQKAEGDREALIMLAEENGIDRDDAQDYLDGAVDELATPLMAAVGERLGVKLRDHIVLTRERYLSFQEAGLMRLIREA